MSEFVSISDLPERLEIAGGTAQGVPLLWDMQLPPHVDIERLQINVSRLRGLHRVGAMTASHVMSYEGDVTETTPNIVGVNADGSAMAGRSGVKKKAEQSRSSYYDLEKLPGHLSEIFGRPVMVHRINRPEAASTVADMTREGKTSEDSWGGVLDKALRFSLREGGRQHLTKRAPAFWRAFQYYIMANVVAGEVSQISEGQAGLALPITYMLAQSTHLGFRALLKSKGLESKQRISVLPFAAQPDRYIALNALSRIPGLISNRK